MIRIEALRAVIHTSTGLFGRTITFKKGLNIIRANNTSGKSSLFGAILYGLGFEELLGSRNDRALQSVFKSVIKEVSGAINIENENIVVQSEIYLQFSNGKESITSKRFIVNDKIKPQAVEVFFGQLITAQKEDLVRQPMYLHDKGSASNEEIGFHKFLEDFIGAKLPEIINQEGKRVKMFLPLVSAAHFIEQKAGWSDFFANIPYYGIRDADAKVFEYLLGFDVFEIAATRQELQNNLKEIADRWTELYERLFALAKRGGGEVIGLSSSPEILETAPKPYLRFLRGDKTFLLSELIDNLSLELKNALDQLHVPTSRNIGKIEDELSNLKTTVNRYEILYDNLNEQINDDKERLRQYVSQAKNVEDDLRKNKDAEKIQNLGLEVDLKIGNGICPTCGQIVTDTLLHEDLHVTPMRIDENISYLQSQQKMINAFVINLREQVRENETKVGALEEAIQSNRQKIRSLKRSLISDDRLPSEDVIERKVTLERELNLLYRLREDFEQGLLGVYAIGKQFEEIKVSLSKLSSNYLSSNDTNKLLAFESYFKSLLQKFNFTSKPITAIKISQEKYLPVYEVLLGNGLNRQVDIRFESSASDYIRSQWAYYTALMNTSLKYSGNHFMTMIFDEPQQQSAATKNFKSFLNELENYKEQQVIVLASFQNSDDDFKEATDDLKYTNIINLASGNEMLIQRI